MGNSGRLFRTISFLALVPVLTLLVGCGDDDTTGPTLGDLAVVTSTTGSDLDPDGYTVTVDGTLIQTIGVNGSVTYTNLETGSRTVQLSGLEANCSVTGENPRTVTVTSDGSSTTFEVVCNSLTGSIEVTTSTTGVDVDQDGYTVLVDGTVSQPIGIDATVTIADLAVGDHSVELTDVADNCTVSGVNPRTVNVPTGPTPQTAQTTFDVNCVQALGDLDVITSTTGVDIDADGYTVEVDGTVMQAVGVNDAVTFTNLSVGDHAVELVGVAANCAVAGSNPRTVNVPFTGAQTTFDVTCSAASGTLQVSTSTSGGNPDPDGYTVMVDGGSPQSIGLNGTVTYTGLSTGDHDVVLTGLASNCGVFGANPRVVTVPGGGSVQTTFDVGCPAPLSGRIAFETNRTGNFEIFLMDTDGSNQTDISNVPGSNERQPDVSPDGSKILFTSDTAGNNDIYVMNPDGSGWRSLTADLSGNHFTAAWSRDGTKIAWSRRSGGQTDVWVMDADGSNKFNLTNNPGSDDEQPTWSPDGSQIAFQTNRDGNMQIYIINSDGSGATRLTNNAGIDFAPSWHPTDPNTIAFSADRNGPGEIWTIDVVTLVETNLTNDPSSDFESSWSLPNGANIAFTSLRNGDAEIYVMNADGSGQTRLTFDPAVDGQPSWSP